MHDALGSWLSSFSRNQPEFDPPQTAICKDCRLPRTKENAFQDAGYLVGLGALPYDIFDAVICSQTTRKATFELKM